MSSDSKRNNFLLFEYSMTFDVRYLANSSVFRKPKISFPPELRKRIKRDLELDYGKDNVCTCSLLEDGTCSEDSNCENRSAQIECGSDCKVKNCLNRKFTKRMYPPLHKFKTWWGGFGLEAKQKITGVYNMVWVRVRPERFRRTFSQREIHGNWRVPGYLLYSLNFQKLVSL